MIRTVEWRKGAVVMIDQRVLPGREEYQTYHDYRGVARAIRTMVVRGAPAIGVAAAFGIALGMQRRSRNPDAVFETICQTLGATRPTAVNLFWAIERMRQVYATVRGRDAAKIAAALLREAKLIHREDIAANRAMGQHGARLVPRNATIMTHCNAGALATAGFGTALGVVRAAHDAGKNVNVIANETRPFLQGARLTAWELQKEGIPTTLITDNMAGHVMRTHGIQCVIVGADRVAANGDVANKIGTYTLAVLAQRHGVPFYVAAPTSTIDLDCPNGDHIPIESRNPREVTHIGARRVAAAGVEILNPAFDVTPNELITAIITERGVARAAYARSLRRVTRSPAPPR